jgi:hypothetical protein
MEKFISGLTLPPSRTGSYYEVALARLRPNPARRPFDRTDHLIQSWGFTCQNARPELLALFLSTDRGYLHLTVF